MGEWKEERRGKGTGSKRHKWQVENRQGEGKNSIGNGEAKELVCTTHGHEPRGAMPVGGGAGQRGTGGWDHLISRSINIFKRKRKEVNNVVSSSTFLTWGSRHLCRDPKRLRPLRGPPAAQRPLCTGRLLQAALWLQRPSRGFTFLMASFEARVFTFEEISFVFLLLLVHLESNVRTHFLVQSPRDFLLCFPKVIFKIIPRSSLLSLLNSGN